MMVSGHNSQIQQDHRSQFGMGWDGNLPDNPSNKGQTPTAEAQRELARTAAAGGGVEIKLDKRQVLREEQRQEG